MGRVELSTMWLAATSGGALAGGEMRRVRFAAHKTESVVTRDSFRQALSRARLGAAGLDAISCGGDRYQLLETLGTGEVSQVYLARRIASLPLLVTIKLSSSPTAVTLYACEAQATQGLQLLDRDGAGPYFSRLLPEVIAQEPEGNDGRHARAKASTVLGQSGGPECARFASGWIRVMQCGSGDACWRY